MMKPYQNNMHSYTNRISLVTEVTIPHFCSVIYLAEKDKYVLSKQITTLDPVVYMNIRYGSYAHVILHI